MKVYFNRTRNFVVLGLAIFISGSCKKGDSSTDPIVDKIQKSLSTSLIAYNNAAANSWVSVTATEYNNLLVIVEGAAKYATPEIYMNTVPTGGWTGNYTVGGSDNAAKVPASSYIIAWSLKSGTGAATATGSKLKVSSSQKLGYVDYGSPLPNAGSIAATTRVYFVLKIPAITTPASPSYTAVFSMSTNFLGNTGNASSGPEYYTAGDVATTSTAYKSDSYSQVISTTKKQW